MNSKFSSCQHCLHSAKISTTNPYNTGWLVVKIYEMSSIVFFVLIVCSTFSSQVEAFLSTSGTFSIDIKDSTSSLNSLSGAIVSSSTNLDDHSRLSTVYSFEAGSPFSPYTSKNPTQTVWVPPTPVPSEGSTTTQTVLPSLHPPPKPPFSMPPLPVPTSSSGPLPMQKSEMDLKRGDFVFDAFSSIS